MKKYKSHSGIALVFAIMIIAVMAITGALALFISTKESSATIVEQQKTRSYYAARTGADVLDKFIQSTSTQDVIALYERYENAKMLYGGDKEDSNTWHPVYYDKKESDGTAARQETGEYFQVLFSKKDDNGIQLVSRGAVLKPDYQVPTGLSSEEMQKAIRENLVPNVQSVILCSYSDTFARGETNRLIPTIIDAAAYANSRLSMRGGSSIVYAKGQTDKQGPALMTGITDDKNIDLMKNKSGVIRYPKIYGQLQVPKKTQALTDTIEEIKVLEKMENLIENDSLPRTYAPIDIPYKGDEFAIIDKGPETREELRMGLVGNYNTVISQAETKYKRIVVGVSNLIVETSKNPKIICEEFSIPSGDLIIKGNGTANIYCKKLSNGGLGEIKVQDSSTVNFYVDELTLDANVILDSTSKVNFYVRNKLIVDGGEYNFNNSEVNNIDQLNIYYYGNADASFNRANWHFKGNIMMASGNLKIGNTVGNTESGNLGDVRPFFVGNIFSAGGNINLSPGLSSNETYKANVFIYAPLSRVSIAPYSEKSLTLDVAPRFNIAGAVVCDDLDIGINVTLSYNAIPRDILPKNEDIAKEMYKVAQVNYRKVRWDKID